MTCFVDVLLQEKQKTLSSSVFFDDTDSVELKMIWKLLWQL